MNLEPRRIGAIIVHYRTPADTARAARAVAQDVPGAELLVVDNDSRDAIAELLAREVPSARVVTEPANRGYGAACNRGARETRGESLLFLNSDAFVEPGAVSALTSALESDPRAAVVGPKLLFDDGSLQPSIQRLPTPWRIFCESSGLAALAGGRGFFRGHTKTREDHSRSRAVESLLGAALLVRRSAFEEVGGFDQSFFLYAEETDLMSRLRARGYRVLYEPMARVVHRGGASTQDLLFGRLYESLTRYVEKFHGRAAATFVAFILRAGAALRYAAAWLTPGEEGRRRRRRYGGAIFGSRLIPRSSPRAR